MTRVIPFLHKHTIHIIQFMITKVIVTLPIFSNHLSQILLNLLQRYGFPSKDNITKQSIYEKIVAYTVFYTVLKEFSHFSHDFLHKIITIWKNIDTFA